MQQEIVLRTSLARALLATKGYTPEVEEAFTGVLELSRAAGDISLMFPVLRSLYSFYTLRGEFGQGVPIGTQILDLAKRQNDGNMQVEGHLILGTGLCIHWEHRPWPGAPGERNFPDRPPPAPLEPLQDRELPRGIQLYRLSHDPVDDGVPRSRPATGTPGN